MLKQIAMIALALVLTISAVSVVSTADQIQASNAINVGNYAVYTNSTTGAVYNLSFVNDNYEATIASSVSANGAAVSSTMLGTYNSDGMKSFGNLTFFTAVNENTMFLATMENHSTLPSITLNLNAPASVVNETQAQQTFLEQHSSALASQFLSNNMYKVHVNGTYFVLFALESPALSNHNTTLTYTAPSSLSGPVVVGISSGSALKDTLENEIAHHGGFPFTYNNATGEVSGRFVSFGFNSSTGLISNFTSVHDNATVFNTISASGNGTIGVNNPSPVYPTMQPIVVGNVFFYGNTTVVYQMHNNPSLVMNFFLSNGTLNMTVANGLNITVYHPNRYEVEHEKLNSTNVNYTGVDLGDQFNVASSSTILFIHNSTFRSSLFVHGATVMVNGSSISITTNNTAKISFVAPPGLQKLRPSLQDAIQNAINDGKLAAYIVLGSPGQSSSNLSVNYNSSLQVNIQNVSSTGVSIKVGSLSHEGTNFAIFVPNGVIANNSQLTLKFDNQTITLSKSIGSVVNATSTVNASFYYVAVSGGTLVVIHVPHFSNHTIEISTASSSPASLLPSLTSHPLLYVAIGIVAVIAVIAAVSLRRKN